MSYQFHMTLIESHNDTPLDSLSIDIAKDTKELSDTNNLSSSLQDVLSSIYASLKQTYTKGYKYHYLSLQLDSNVLILILLIPQRIPKVYKEPYKNYEFKDYGIGKYHYLYNYCTHIMLDTKNYTQIGLESNPSNATILTLHTAYKAQKLEITLANGLDSIIESRDRQRQAKLDREYQKSHNNTKQQSIDSLLTITLINGGYKDKLWGFREQNKEENKVTQENLLQTHRDTIDTENKDSKATQENKQKQILEIYFSYGNDMIRLQGVSRHSSDLNLHIITQGYEEGERLDLTLEFQGKAYQTTATIRDNQAIILNVFNES